MRKKLLTNIGSNLTVLMVRVMITLVMTPLYLRVLGNYDYGVWEIISALIGYMGILDIGIKPTVARYIAKYHAVDDRSGVNAVYSTACLFMLLMGIVSALLLLASGYAWQLRPGGDGYDPRLMLLLSIVAIHLVAQFPSLVTDGAMEGFQHYTLKNLLLSCKGVLVALFAYLFIESYDGLIMLALISALGMVFKYFVGVTLLRMPRNGGLVFSLKDCSREVFLTSLGFGIKSFVQGIASRIQLGSDRIIIGYFLGPALVPVYAIPANLISYIRNIGWTITDVFMPLFSSLDARNQRDAILRIYLTASRFCIGLLLPVSIGAVLVGGPFIEVWLGAEYREHAEVIIQLLVLFTMLPFLNPFSTRYLTALGKHGLLAKLYPFAAVASIVLGIALVGPLGVIGVALAMLLPMFVITPIVLKQCCNSLGITIYDYMRATVVPSLLPALVLVVVVGLFRYVTRLDTYAELLLAVLLGAVSYAPVFFLTGLQMEERGWMIGQIRNRVTGKPVFRQ